MTNRLSARDALLALAVILVWGVNFVVIRLGLDVLPSLFFAFLRFLFVALPACFFLPRPRVPWKWVVLYGLSLGLIQFGLLFIAMNGMISPGLASLVVQMQVFFTVGFAIWRASARGGHVAASERLGMHHAVAGLLALAGMAVIGAHNGHGTTIAGLLLTLGAGLGWAISNQAAREAARAAKAAGIELNMLALVVWGSLFAVPPLLALSLALEGPSAILNGLRHAGFGAWAAVAYQSFGNTIFGYGVWAILLSRYPAATVSPLSLLVPVVGFAASAVWLGEALPLWKIGATLLIMAGLAVNLLWQPRKAAISGEAC
jgi:O-acetylserine/cysteine efflux transporter